jgi:hypothetical protein
LITKENLFRRWAAQQGMARPFSILSGLSHGEREQIAEHLSMSLAERDEVWDEAIEQALDDLGIDKPRPPKRLQGDLLAEAEAVHLIGCDNDGIQARSHSATRTLNPTAENHTWDEVLHSIIKEFKIRCADKSTDGMETAIFEHVAAKAVAEMSADEKKDLRELEKEAPELREKLLRAGYGPKAAQLVMAGLAKATMKSGFKAYIQAVKLAGAANRKLGTKFVMKNVTVGLKGVLRGANVLLWAWLAADVVGWMFGPSRQRLLMVVAQVRSAALLEQMKDSPL